jgi:hypothetical protein
LTALSAKLEFCQGQRYKGLDIQLAAGAGIEAATNIVVKKAMHNMLY